MKAIKKMPRFVAVVAALSLALATASCARIGADASGQPSVADTPPSVVTAASRAPAEAPINAQPGGPDSSPASTPAATQSAATKQVTTTKKTGVTAPKATTTKGATPASGSKKPIGGVIHDPKMGTTDPSKVGQYCTVIGGKYYGKLCPKSEGSPV